jgi:hypothetical protein
MGSAPTEQTLISVLPMMRRTSIFAHSIKRLYPIKTSREK